MARCSSERVAHVATDASTGPGRMTVTSTRRGDAGRATGRAAGAAAGEWATVAYVGGLLVLGLPERVGLLLDAEGRAGARRARAGAGRARCGCSSARDRAAVAGAGFLVVAGAGHGPVAEPAARRSSGCTSRAPACFRRSRSSARGPSGGGCRPPAARGARLGGARGRGRQRGDGLAPDVVGVLERDCSTASTGARPACSATRCTRPRSSSGRSRSRSSGHGSRSRRRARRPTRLGYLAACALFASGVQLSGGRTGLVLLGARGAAARWCASGWRDHGRWSRPSRVLGVVVASVGVPVRHRARRRASPGATQVDSAAGSTVGGLALPADRGPAGARHRPRACTGGRRRRTTPWPRRAAFGADVAVPGRPQPRRRSTR